MDALGRALLGGLMLLCAASATARTVNATPEDYRSLLRQLRPGDVLSLAPGDYRDGLPLHRLAGSAQAPIVISGPEGDTPAVFHAAPGRNTVSLIDAAFIVLRALRLEGHGLPVDAVKAEGHSRYAHHITLEKLLIRGHGNNQQTVGISSKCPAWGWTIRGNTLLGPGTGIYLGNSDGSAPFVAGVIEHNLVLDPIGYALQVKHQAPRPGLEGMPAGPSVTVIRHNVFAKPAAGDRQRARPNVLLGHFPLHGPGSDDRYAVYGNLFYENRHEALFQGEGNVALYANLFVNRHGDAIHIQPHNDIPRDIVIARNTVVAAGVGLRILERDGASAQPPRLQRNVLFAGTPLSGAPLSGNVAGALSEASRWLRAPFAEPGTLDLRATRGWPTLAAPDAGPLAAMPDAGIDFDGRLWRPESVGAYGDAGAPLKWWPDLRIKP